MIEVESTTLPEAEALKLKADAGYLVVRRTDGQILKAYPAPTLEAAKRVQRVLLKRNRQWPVDICCLYSRAGGEA